MPPNVYPKFDYTDTDLFNANKYSQQRLNLIYLARLYEKVPHIASWLNVNIRPATNEDYFIPDKFIDKCIVSSVEMTKRVCDKISCNASTTTGECKPKQSVINYRVGYTDVIEHACQPACYNLKDLKTYDDEGNLVPQSARTKYKDGSCLIVPPSLAWLEMPIYRSDMIYEMRVNDLPTGFDVTDVDDANNNFGIKIDYNKSYCESFYKDWDPESKSCKISALDHFLNAVVGESIIQLAKSGINIIASGGKSQYPPLDTPPLPPVDEMYNLKNWLNDVNLEFILPDFDVNVSELDESMNPPSMIKKDKLNAPVYNMMINRHKETFRKALNELNVADKLDEAFGLNTVQERTEEEKESVVQGVINDIIVSLGPMLENPQFWAELGISFAAEAALDLLKDFLKRSLKDYMPKLIGILKNMGGKFMTGTFKKAFGSTIARTVGSVGLKLVGKLMGALLKLAIAFASVVEIILLIITFLDILLSIWDPLGFSNMFNNEVLDDLHRNAEAAQRLDFSSVKPEISFQLLSNLIFTEVELVEMNLGAFSHTYEYLSSLVVNSNGNVINKGEEIDVHEGNFENNAELAARRFTQSEIWNFEKKHMDRMHTFNDPMLNWLLGGSAGLVGVFIVLQLYTFAVVAFFGMCLLFYYKFLNVDTDIVMDNINLIKKYIN